MRSDNNSIVIIGGGGSTAVEHRIKTKAFHLFFPIGKKVMPDMHPIMKAELASKSNCRLPVRLYLFHRSLLPSYCPQPSALPVHQRATLAVTIEPALRSLSQSLHFTWGLPSCRVDLVFILHAGDRAEALCSSLWTFGYLLKVLCHSGVREQFKLRGI